MVKMNYNSYQQQGYGGMINQQNFAMMQQTSHFNGMPGNPYYPSQQPYQPQGTGYNGYTGDSSNRHRNRSSCNFYFNYE